MTPNVARRKVVGRAMSSSIALNADVEFCVKDAVAVMSSGI